MINTTPAYKEAINSNREFCVKDKITFADGTTMFLTMDDFLNYSINEATSSSGKFEIGAAVIKEYNATLKNDDGRFDAYNFEGADLLAQVGLKLANGTWEMIQKGAYRIVSAKATEMSIQIKAYDSMLFFDKPYSESKLAYPATITQIIREACTSCQMTFDNSTIEMGNYTVKTRPNVESLTYRDVISYCAQIMGCYARINHMDRLSFGWYAFDALKNGYDGGNFDDDMPYSSGDILDGGNFDNYSSGARADGGTFDDLNSYHHFYNLSSQTINTDDICITGIQVSAKGENSDDVESAMYGKDGYVLELSENPLIQTGAVDAVASYVGEKLKNKTFRPLSITVQSDPSVESGDAALVTDRKQRTYQTVITNTTFTLCGLQKIECTAETPTEKSYTKYGAVTKLISKASEETERKLSAYDIAVQQMSQIAANTMGFFATTVKQEDGSVIVYRHDKQKLAESKVVYKSGIDGFFVTQEYTGNDSTTAWRAGFDSNGNAVLNILSVVGINFSWARGGTLTLGGYNNESGLLQLIDNDGNVVGEMDKDGFSLKKGVIENVDESTGTKTQMSKGALNFYKDDERYGGIHAAYIENQKKGIFIAGRMIDSNPDPAVWIGVLDSNGMVKKIAYRMTGGFAVEYMNTFFGGTQFDRLYTDDAKCKNGQYVKSFSEDEESFASIKNIYISRDTSGNGNHTLWLNSKDGTQYSINVKSDGDELPIG